MNSFKESSKYLERALIELNKDEAEKIIIEATKSSSPIDAAGVLISETLSKIGNSWEAGEVSLSQVYMGGLICEQIIDKILPPQSPLRKYQPKTAIGVFEDFHLLGKRIVYATLRASGIELLDIGGGLTIDQVVNIVRKEQVKILLLSVLMLPSAIRIKDLVHELKDDDVKIIVGGAPFRFDDKLWLETGAHYYGKDSSEALKIVTQLMDKTV